MPPRDLTRAQFEAKLRDRGWGWDGYRVRVEVAGIPLTAYVGKETRRRDVLRDMWRRIKGVTCT